MRGDLLLTWKSSKTQSWSQILAQSNHVYFDTEEKNVHPHSGLCCHVALHISRVLKLQIVCVSFILIVCLTMMVLAIQLLEISQL